MLRTLTWVLLGGMLAGNVLSLISEYQQAAAARAAMGRGTAMGLPANLKMGVSCMSIVRDLIVGLGFVFVGQAIARIDALSAWLGWRSGGVAQLPENSKSSLHYILPLCVSGGLISIGALLFWSMSDDFGGALGQSNTVIAVWILLFGVVLFMNGLGFGDLSQFFQRMTALGRGVRLRKRGTEVGLGEPLRPSPPVATNSPVYLLLATAALAVCFALGAFAGKTAAGLTGTMWIVALAVGGTLGLIIIGGVYSMYHLSLAWREALAAWEWAAASVTQQRESRKRSTSRAPAFLGFGFAAHVLTFVQITLALFIWALMPLKTPFELKVLMVGGVAFSILFLLWIGALRRDVFRFRSALQACAGQPHARGGSGALPWALYGLAFLYTLGIVVVAWVAIGELLPMCQQKENYAGPLGVGLGLTALLGYAAMPVLWLGLTVRDFGAAQKSLAELREKIDG